MSKKQDLTKIEKITLFIAILNTFLIVLFFGIFCISENRNSQYSTWLHSKLQTVYDRLDCINKYDETSEFCKTATESTKTESLKSPFAEK